MTGAADKRPGRLSVFGYGGERAGRGPMLAGLLLIVPIIAAFALWSALAPLNAAAMAPGEVVLTSERKTIQHLEGGLVTELLVAEGEAVEAGTPLLVVQDLSQRGQIEALEVQLASRRAEIARLKAERDDLETPDFDAVGAGLSLSPAAIEEFRASHLAVLQNQRAGFASVADLALSRKAQIAKEIEGQAAQMASAERQLELLSKEIAASEALKAKGLSTEKQHIQLQRDEAALDGQIGALIASVAKLEQSIIDQDLEIIRMTNERRTAMFAELQASEVAASEIGTQLATLRDQRDRSVLRAPVAGRVLDLKVHTVGAVIAPGEPLMDIVPDTDDLTIEARVSPVDIDLVSEGMEAELQLSAYSQRRAPRIRGRLVSVSGDILTDEMSGERYFLARLIVDEDALAALPEDVRLSPGMPADVFLIAGERTVADYLLTPIVAATSRAFRED